MKINKKELGKAIAYQRMLKGLGPAGLGELFEMTSQAINKWESGASAPTVDKWPRLKELLGVDVMEYVQVVGNKNITKVSGPGVALSAKEATIIELLRQKDKNGVLANRILTILLQEP